MNYYSPLKLNLNTGVLFAEPEQKLFVLQIYQASVIVPITELILYHNSNTHSVITQIYDDIDDSVSHELIILDKNSVKIITEAPFTGTINIMYNASTTPSISSILPNGMVGELYSGQIIGLSGVAPYTYTVTEPLPENLILDRDTGIISGTPESSSTRIINRIYYIKDSTNKIYSKELSFIIESDSRRITKIGNVRITKAGNVRVTKEM